MTDIAIRVENLSKQYRIGVQDKPPQSLRQVITSFLGSPFKYLNTALRPPTHDEIVWALKDVSFEVKQGEVIGVIGRNGAGKSTLLKILSRITEPTTGYAEIHGRVASLLEVGAGFHPELTGRENIYLNGTIMGMKKREIDRRFDEIVDFAGVEKYIDTPVKRYSSGMYVRLAFAVAAHLEPEILIVDEVLAVGDAVFQRKCLGKMGDVSKKEGRTVLFVSHNMGAVNTLCGKTVLLVNGSVAQIGDTDRVVKSYLLQEVHEISQQRKGYSLNLKVLNEQGECDMKITDIIISNPQKLELGPCTGDPMVIRVTYQAQVPFESPAFVVSIKDFYDQEIIRLGNMPIGGYQFVSLAGNGYVELLIKKLPLVAGRYYVDIGFAKDYVEWVFRLENVLELEVMPQDVYKSGVLMDRSRGMIVVEHSWNHAMTDS